jgi:hypothetical protein
MKRIRTLVVLMFGAVLASALPAQAKGVTNASFTGPGLPPGGITVRTDDGNGGAGPLGHALMEGLASVFEDYKLDAPPVPKSDLGPEYRATLAFDFAPKPLHATLYPYADGGPAMFIPAGQELGPEFEVPTLPGGWTATDATFRDTLVELGFPETAPLIDAAFSPNDPLPAERRLASPNPWTVPLIVGGILTVLLVTALIVLRARRHAAAA